MSNSPRSIAVRANPSSRGTPEGERADAGLGDTRLTSRTPGSDRAHEGRWPGPRPVGGQARVVVSKWRAAGLRSGPGAAGSMDSPIRAGRIQRRTGRGPGGPSSYRGLIRVVVHPAPPRAVNRDGRVDRSGGPGRSGTTGRVAGRLPADDAGVEIARPSLGDLADLAGGRVAGAGDSDPEADPMGGRQLAAGRLPACPPRCPGRAGRAGGRGHRSSRPPVAWGSWRWGDRGTREVERRGRPVPRPWTSLRGRLGVPISQQPAAEERVDGAAARSGCSCAGSRRRRAEMRSVVP